MLPPRLAAVGRITQNLAAATTLLETLPVVAREGAQSLGAPHAALFMYDDDDGGTLRLGATYGLVDDIVERGNRLLRTREDGPAVRAFVSGELVEAQDITLSTSAPLRSLLLEQGVRSAVAVPLNFADQRLGVLAVYWDEVRELSADERVFLTTLGHLASAAIYHARLIELVFTNIRQTDAIFAHVPAGVAYFSPKLALIRANPQAERYLVAMSGGLSLDEHRTFDELAKSCPEAALAAHEALASGDVREIEGLRLADGFVDLSLVPILADAGSGLLVFLTDATGRIRRTELLELAIAERTSELQEANERLAAANQLKADFVAIASHELRTPMTAIKGYAMLLQEPDLSPAEQADSVRIVSEQTDRLTRILDDLLDLTTLEAGRMPVKVSEMRLAQALARTRDLLARKYPDRAIETEAIEATLRTDADKFEQILVNLVDNACKYTAPGAPIHVSARREDDFLEVRVHNEGPGLSEREQAQLFEKFQRLDRLRNKARGTGLGLFITRLLVDLLGGKIWVESEENAGVTFCFRLPEMAEIDEG